MDRPQLERGLEANIVFGSFTGFSLEPTGVFGDNRAALLFDTAATGVFLFRRHGLDEFSRRRLFRPAESRRVDMTGKKASSLRDRLASALLEYDGKTTTTLEVSLAELEQAPQAADVLLELMVSGEPVRERGASWLLKALLEGGVVLDRKRVAMLARSLEQLEDDWAALHVCQLIRFLEIPARNADQFSRFLERFVTSEHKFLRAWSIDGYWRLASSREIYLPRALELIARGANDPAASVKARVRDLRREMER